ncbi:MAG: hypothetical protein HY369_02160 [Candidatus Aenigmarchaeota archaeon]|nr:hypothetical protein [Candidatus Aenigmarchaeota archaeon]
MLVRKSDLKQADVHPGFTIWRSEVGSKRMSVVLGLIEGSHPQSGRVANMTCEEMYYVLEGEGTIFSERGTFPIKKGDIYHFLPGEKFRTVGRKLKLVIVNSPSWTEEQVTYFK